MQLKENYTFAEINAAQKLPLNEKIKISLEVLKQVQQISRHGIGIAFSGGKDSQVVADLIERFCPELHKKCFLIFGNTGVEFPESLKFAREYGKKHFGDRFFETKPLPLPEDELRYDAARMLFACGDLESIKRARPCAYDEIGDMMELEKTEYDPENENLEE